MPILRIGIADVVPKSFAYRLLAPVGKLPEPVRLVCREGSIDMLLAELALHHLDMVVADRPMPSDWPFAVTAISWVKAPWPFLRPNPCAPSRPLSRNV